MNGLFLLQWTDEEGYVLKGSFFHEGDVSKIESIMLRIATSHEPAKEYSTVPTRDSMVYSRLVKFKDVSRKMQKIIVGVDLPTTEGSDEYKAFLVEASRQVQEHLADDKEAIGQMLCAMYASRQPQDQSSDLGADLQTRIVSRAQGMIAKDQIDEAQDLLEKAKVMPQQIQKMVEKGAKLVKQQKLDEAKKFYDDAVAMARELHEQELASRLADEFGRLSERPKTIERLVDLEDKALKAMREENYKRASELFRDAGKEASKLNDVDAMNEFSKKAQLLIEFHTVDKARKRSF